MKHPNFQGKKWVLSYLLGAIDKFVLITPPQFVTKLNNHTTFYKDSFH